MTESTISFSQPKSILHYWLQLSHGPTQDFIRLLDYLSERDLGLLEIALTERDLIKFFIEPLKVYYKTHEISIAKINRSKSHLDWLLTKGLNYYIQKLVISYIEPRDELNFDNYNTCIKFPNLLEVKLWCISSKLCEILGSYSPNLHTLKILNGGDELTVESIVSICSGCPHLKYIQISEHPEMKHIEPPYETLSIISTYCKELEVLKLNNWDRVESDDITCLSQLTNLLELDIELVYGWCTFPTQLLASNSRLENVVLGGDLSHDTIMRRLGAHCHLLKRVWLGAWAWREVTDGGIIAMVQGCPLLERIDIGVWNSSWGHNYEDDFDEDFVPIVSVTNTAMYAIAEYCIHLIVFRISSADPLTYDSLSLDAIKRGCPSIKAIYRDGKVYYTAPGYVPDQCIDDDYGDSDSDSNND